MLAQTRTSTWAPSPAPCRRQLWRNTGYLTRRLKEEGVDTGMPAYLE